MLVPRPVTRLAQRMLQNNEDTYLADTLRTLVQEIGEDKQTLEDVAARLALNCAGWKLVLGSVSEAVARLKANGRLVSYSPLSRLEEFEMLAAGIVDEGIAVEELRAEPGAAARADRHRLHGAGAACRAPARCVGGPSGARRQGRLPPALTPGSTDPSRHVVRAAFLVALVALVALVG